MSSFLAFLILLTMAVILQSIYWKSASENSQSKSYTLRKIVLNDMAHMGNSFKEDTVLTNAIKELNTKSEKEKQNSIYYKIFGKEIPF